MRNGSSVRLRMTITRATGDRDGELPVPGRLRERRDRRAVALRRDGRHPDRELACEWGDRSSRATPCCHLRPGRPGRTLPFLAGRQQAQTGSRTLQDLAVLLLRPAVAPAELGRWHVHRQLTRERQALICGQLARQAAHAAQIVAQHHRLLHRRATVAESLALVLGSAQRDGRRKRGCNRAAPGSRAPRVADTRDEAQLQRVAQVPAIGESPAATRMCQQLKRRLAVTVLEVLPPKLMAMRAQEHVPPRAGDECDLVDRVGPRGWSSAPTWGRHIDVSTRARIRPPSRLLAAGALGVVRPHEGRRCGPAPG